MSADNFLPLVLSPKPTRDRGWEGAVSFEVRYRVLSSMNLSLRLQLDNDVKM